MYIGINYINNKFKRNKKSSSRWSKNVDMFDVNNKKCNICLHIGCLVYWNDIIYILYVVAQNI